MTDYESALNMAEKFRAAEKKVAEDRGEFYLFGLFERERTPGKWDIVAAAPWLTTDRNGTLNLMIALRDKMETADWNMIGGIFPIEPSATYVEWITKNYHLKHQIEEVTSAGFGNVRISHAFLITANPMPTFIANQSVAA